ncbi:MAG: hypothetical protein HS117_18105 [Verrucomicrobiaceae bacterium]|nr:hypothetical protein [Verrucomicrobiaceae bacterium]
MHDSTNTTRPDVKPGSFNVRYRGSPDAALAWGRENKVHIKLFENFDGGGFNHYICEFATLMDASGFRSHFDIEGDNTLWIEDVSGGIYYLNASEESIPVPAADSSPDEPVWTASHVVNPASSKWPPASVDELGLSEEEMEIWVKGARLLFGQEDADTGPELDPG